MFRVTEVYKQEIRAFFRLPSACSYRQTVLSIPLIAKLSKNTKDNSHC